MSPQLFQALRILQLIHARTQCCVQLGGRGWTCQGGMCTRSSLCHFASLEVITKYSNFISFPVFLNGRSINSLQVRRWQEVEEKHQWGHRWQ